MKLTTIAIITLLLTSLNCKKDTANPLPPATHTGAFTFGCKVDGKVYTAIGQGGGLLATELVSYTTISNDSEIFIYAANRDNPNFTFNLTINYPGKPGTYLMKGYPYQGMFTDDSNGTIPGSDNNFTTTDSITGSVTVTYFDGIYYAPLAGKILAGTFQMDAVNGEGKVVHIIDGRFDIGY